MEARALVRGWNVVGEGTIAHMGFAAGIDTMDIGAERGSPVSDSYSAAAIFNGKVKDLRLSIERERTNIQSVEVSQ